MGYAKYIYCAFLSAYILLLFVGGAGAMGVKPRSPLIEIEGQVAHLSPAFHGVGSVFMKIKNAGTGDDVLLSVAINTPGVAHLHDVRDGKMVRIDRITIPSGSTLDLRPAGPHIMLFKLPKQIEEGYEITLRLAFEKSGEKEVSVKFVGPSGVHVEHNH